MQQQTVVLVEAEWDADAGVWVATSDDVPGLTAEHADFNRLRDMVVELAPMLLAENGLLPPGNREIGVHIAAHGLARASARLAA